MTAQQINNTGMPDAGLGELLALQKKSPSQAGGTGDFLGILDKALGKDRASQSAEPVQVQQSPVQEPAKAQSPQGIAQGGNPGNESAESLSQQKNTVPVAQSQAETSGLKSRLSQVRELLLKNRDAGTAKNMPLPLQEKSVQATRGMPATQVLPQAVEPQAAKRSESADAKNNKTTGTKGNEKKELKDAEKPAPGSLRERAAETLAALQGQLAAQTQPKAAPVQGAEAAGQTGLLGKALDTIKNLGAQLDSKKEDVLIRELNLSDLLSRKAPPSKNLSRAGTESFGLANRMDSRLETDTRAVRSSDPRLRAQRGTEALARTTDVTDLRGKSSLDAAHGGRVMLQSGESLVQAAVSTQSISKAGSGEKGSSTFDPGVNAAWVPAQERVLQMPVQAGGQAGGQSLRDWLRSQGGKEIAQEAKILLKDGGVGEIKLILHPEELGEVRINLQIQDGRIAGDIFVENDEVRKAFEEQIASLNEAFKENGFADTSFNVSLGGQGGQDMGQFMKREPEEQRKPDPYAIESLERQVAVVQELGYGNAQIDLVV